jgi:hypothetical protein
VDIDQRLDLDVVRRQTHDRRRLLADETRRLEGFDAVLPAIDEVIRRAAVERLLRLRREEEGAAAARCPAVRRQIFEMSSISVR